MKIEAYGQVLNTKHFTGELELDKIKEVRENFYTATKEQADEQLRKLLLKGGSQTNYIYGYYFEEIANDGKTHHAKFSINEVLNSDEPTQLFINRTKVSPKVFTSKELTPNFKTAIRLGGKGVAVKLTNFPYKECVALLKKYTYEGAKVYIDPSCGWGIRMLASAYLGLGYIGFDVNPKLISKLNELGEAIKQIKPEFMYGIIPQGSEIYLPSLDSSADIIMTSPPYYALEDYTHVIDGAQIITELTYSEWVKSFVKPLMCNLANYAKVGAYILINVKDYGDYTLVSDFTQAGTEAGLSFVGYDLLKNNKRINIETSNEKVIILQKIDNSGGEQ